jgi:hypothetical protein
VTPFDGRSPARQGKENVSSNGRQADINERATSEVAQGRGVGAALIAVCE